MYHHISLAKASATSISSNFIVPYLDGNITQAYQLLPEKTSSQNIQKLIDIITSRYIELVEFEKTLDLFE